MTPIPVPVVWHCGNCGTQFATIEGFDRHKRGCGHLANCPWPEPAALYPECPSGHQYRPSDVRT